MRKILAHRVPRLLAVHQKHTRWTLSRANLKLSEAGPANLLHRFVTMDEMGVHHFTTEAKQLSKQWTHPGSPPLNKAQKRIWPRFSRML